MASSFPLLLGEREELGCGLPRRESKRKRGGAMGRRDERKIMSQSIRKSIRKRKKLAHEDLLKCVPPRTLRGGTAALLDSRELY